VIVEHNTPVWFQEEFPWLDRGFVHAIDDRFERDLVRRLAELGFTVAVLDPDPGGPPVRVASAFAVALYRALGFIEYEPVALSWDAVHDNFADVSWPARFALIWRRADEFAQQQTKTFAEACAVLTREFDDLGTTSQAVIILCGRGPEFRTPRDIRGR
jgi:hypothetical protein